MDIEYYKPSKEVKLIIRISKQGKLVFNEAMINYLRLFEYEYIKIGIDKHRLNNNDYVLSLETTKSEEAFHLNTTGNYKIIRCAKMLEHYKIDYKNKKFYFIVTSIADKNCFITLKNN